MRPATSSPLLLTIRGLAPGQRIVDGFNYAGVMRSLAGYFSNDHDNVSKSSVQRYHFIWEAITYIGKQDKYELSLFMKLKIL